MYEAMFLMDSGFAANWEQVEQAIGRLAERADAELFYCKSWDERRLAYEIKGHKRGLYILAYLKLDPETISEIEHDCQLNEKVLRVMILQKDNLTEDELGGKTPATIAAARAEQAAIAKAEEEAAKAAEEAAKAEAGADEPEAPAGEIAEGPGQEADEGDGQDRRRARHEESITVTPRPGQAREARQSPESCWR